MGIKKFLRCFCCASPKKVELPTLFRSIYDPNYHETFSHTPDAESISSIPAPLPIKSIENKNTKEIRKKTDMDTTEMNLVKENENGPANCSSKADDEQDWYMEHKCFEDNRFNFWVYPVLMEFNYRKKRRALIKKGSLNRVYDLTLGDISKSYVYHRYDKVKKARATFGNPVISKLYP